MCHGSYECEQDVSFLLETTTTYSMAEHQLPRKKEIGVPDGNGVCV